MNRLEHSDPTYPLFPIFAFLGFVLPLVPLPWHFQSWNSGTCWYIFWASLSCLNQFVNSIVWAGNTLNSAPAWCEISIRIMMGASVGLPAASLCINRRLYHIASVRAVVVTKAESLSIRSSAVSSLQYISPCNMSCRATVSIYSRTSGATPTFTTPSPHTSSPSCGPSSSGSSPPSIASSPSARSPRAAPPSPSSSPPTPPSPPARYLRLSALALTDLLLTAPLAVFTIYLNVTATPISPWISWADTHFNFGNIEDVPRILWTANASSHIAVELTRWASPVCGLVFFAFFGFGEEARRHYVLFFGAVSAGFWRGMGRMGVQRPTRGIFAPRATSSTSASTGSKGIGYTKPTPSQSKSLDISLPAYSRSGTGSFTAGSFDADLKRAASFASASTAPSTSASSSRFVERFGIAEKGVGEEVSVSSVYSADGHVDSHASASFVLPDTPASGTSFAYSSTTTTTTTTGRSPTSPGYVLPLHVGWAEHAYPASPTSPGHRYVVEGEGGVDTHVRCALDTS
ncbi:Pheromone receptor [Mycena venus]|uniref:Pheromone receptor n=1 Tax=Mycena venus TaxID=2733690 RepID=A0A8H6XMZ0_9AGAR|nr:Pheromone receptor [Mycena venus]